MEEIELAAKKAHFWIAMLLGGAVAVVVVTIGFTSYFGSYAKAETLAKQAELTAKNTQDIAVLQAVVPLMAEQVKVIFEVTRQEQYEKRHIIIPDPSAARPDAGASR